MGRGTNKKVEQLREWAMNGHEGFDTQGIKTPLERVAAMEAGLDVLHKRGDLSPPAQWVVEKGCKAAAIKRSEAPKMRTLTAPVHLHRNTSARAFDFLEIAE